MGFVPVVVCLYAGRFFQDVEEEKAFARRRDPMAYLREWRGQHYRQVLAELDLRQRSEGQIARLGQEERRGPYTLSAAFRIDGTELATATGTVAYRWHTGTGTLLETAGDATRRRAEDPSRYGFGFDEVVYLEPGRRLAGLTGSEPYHVWIFGEAAPLRIPLGEARLGNLHSRGNQLAMVRELEYGVVLDVATGQTIRLPHNEINVIGFAANGAVVTASRTEIRFWRGANLARTVAWAGDYNPAGFSDEGDLLLMVSGRQVEVWDTATGRKKFDLHHGEEARGVCAAGGRIVTGSRDGRVSVWSAETGTLVRAVDAHPNPVQAIFCGPGQFLSVGDDRTDARLWDLAGRPSLNPVPPPLRYEHNWLVRQGAAADLPGKMPAVAAWFVAAADETFLAGVVLLAVWLGLTYWALRR